MLRMDARKLNNTLFIYDLAKLFIGYLMAGIVAVITGAPFWLWLGIPVLAVLDKAFGNRPSEAFSALGSRTNITSRSRSMLYLTSSGLLWY